MGEEMREKREYREKRRNERRGEKRRDEKRAYVKIDACHRRVLEPTGFTSDFSVHRFNDHPLAGGKDVQT